MKKSLIPWRRETATPAMIRREDDPFVDLHRRMNELFGSFFSDFETDSPFAPASRRPTTALPRVDVSESDREVVVSADLPGMDEKDVSVTLDNDILTLRGARSAEREEQKRDYHLMERSYGEFHRAIPLPSGIDKEKAKATFKKGVLTVTLPKTPETESKKKTIAIEGA